jgi:hypothetical protein
MLPAINADILALQRFDFIMAPATNTAPITQLAGSTRLNEMTKILTENAGKTLEADYEARVFDMVRVSYLLANKKFVISEVGHDQEIEKFFAKGMIFSPYHHLVETCMAYLKKEDQRREIAEQGFNLIRMHPQSSCLKKVLGGDEGLHGNQSKINSHTQVGAYYAE